MISFEEAAMFALFALYAPQQRTNPDRDEQPQIITTLTLVVSHFIQRSPSSALGLFHVSQWHTTIG